ncbi:hypothetical protein CYLTODRAFT_448017 [Cylindrobasidium torrendii FP15055 ss-10]|uniref:Uncharacterized protein n=1 Tax=Cylindrobasidium torrendii FP15055 ss-10 TaxID=1314674 RepID=A0A0D7BUT0_9AGAR|nr:hypothetical protein CYLTODRAFT_448017 [Cylindrobasidium torrendii FP15055 ss-10]
MAEEEPHGPHDRVRVRPQEAPGGHHRHIEGDSADEGEDANFVGEAVGTARRRCAEVCLEGHDLRLDAEVARLCRLGLDTHPLLADGILRVHHHDGLGSAPHRGAIHHHRQDDHVRPQGPRLGLVVVKYLQRVDMMVVGHRLDCRFDPPPGHHLAALERLPLHGEGVVPL